MYRSVIQQGFWIIRIKQELKELCKVPILVKDIKRRILGMLGHMIRMGKTRWLR
jgi:hypothetical protein